MIVFVEQLDDGFSGKIKALVTNFLMGSLNLNLRFLAVVAPALLSLKANADSVLKLASLRLRKRGLSIVEPSESVAKCVRLKVNPNMRNRNCGSLSKVAGKAKSSNS